jgi:NAD(P)-dependent dehydrogenase (short-subunit alcohol dehydrogenase family)
LAMGCNLSPQAEQERESTSFDLLNIPGGRVSIDFMCGSAQEMAGTAIYLASPAGCYTNGQEIVIDGGFVAVNPATV